MKHFFNLIQNKISIIMGIVFLTVLFDVVINVINIPILSILLNTSLILLAVSSVILTFKSFKQVEKG